ncbi:MAG: DUF4439 domain-containing protein [Demequinaceae bacterium]|nr:DUF4439 domain-containing protein [Demequinaceae bacterium]
MVGMGLSGSAGQGAARGPRRGWLRGGLRARAAALACGSVLALTACDLRLETDAPTFPSPAAAVVARDSLADAEAAVLAAATAAGASADGVATGAAATAQAHLDALGGVYVAYPGTTPSPSASPGPAPTLADTITAVRATAEEVAASTDDANLASLARSIDLEWALRELWALRSAANTAAEEAAALALASASPTPEAAEGDPSVAPAATLPGDHGASPFPLADGSVDDAAGFVPATATGIGQEDLSALALAEDEARFTYETIAAWEFGDLQAEVLARSRLHGERSDALTALLTSELRAADPRTPLYQLRDANLPDPGSREALERSIELDLGARYAALLDGTSAVHTAWLLNAAFDSYARAMATAGFAAADLPTLPGLRIGAGTSSASPKPSAPTASAAAPSPASSTATPSAG